jgi:hypothetical protein
MGQDSVVAEGRSPALNDGDLISQSSLNFRAKPLISKEKNR